MEIMIEN